MRLNTSRSIIERLGEPRDNTSNLARLYLPYDMVLSWREDITIRSILCHPIIFEPLSNVFEELLDCYGYGLIKELNIHKYGGCYNYRIKRGASNYNTANLSSHSWAIAIDLDPNNNKLRWRKDKASFARPEYYDMMGIFYANGFYNLGIERNYDFMHFEYKIK